MQIRAQEKATPNEKIKQNIKARRVELPLPKQLVHYYSSDDYIDLVGSGLGPADLGFTYFARYPGVFKSFLKESNQMGPFIEATAQDWRLALLFYVALGIASAVNFYDAYQGKKKAHEAKNDSYKRIHAQLNPSMQAKVEPAKPITNEIYNQSICNEIDRINAQLKKIQKNSNKYETIEITRPDEKATTKVDLNDIKIILVFNPKTRKPKNPVVTETAPVKTELTEALLPKEQKESAEFKEQATPKEQEEEAIEKPSLYRRFINKVVNPLYQTMSWTACFYWILFIGAAVATGNFADAGIHGLSTWLGFGIPVAAALPYPILKIRNWVKNKGHISDEHARLTKMAENDVPGYFAEAMENMAYEEELNKLIAQQRTLAEETKALNIELKSNAAESKKLNDNLVIEDNSLGAQPAVKAAAEFYTGVVSTYGMASYNAWVFSDFLKVTTTLSFALPIFGQVIGGIMIGLTLLVAGIDAYKKYRDGKKHFDQVGTTTAENRKTIKDLEREFDTKKSILEELENNRNKELPKLNQACTLIKEPLFELSKSLKPIPKRPQPTSTIRKIMSYFDWAGTGAFFFRALAGAATFLPFAAVAVFPPLAIGLMVASAVIFLGVKSYQAYQKKKEADAKELVEKIQEMDKQIVIAQKTEAVIDAKLTIANRKIAEMKPIEVKQEPTLDASKKSSLSIEAKPSPANAGVFKNRNEQRGRAEVIPTTACGFVR